MSDLPDEYARVEASIAALWQELLEKDDRTSPAEYPDMLLISFEEFAAAIRRSLSESR